MKIIINVCFGGFGLSNEAFNWLVQNKGWRITDYSDDGGYVDPTAEIVRNRYHGGTEYCYSSTLDDDVVRQHPDVIEAVEILGGRADGDFAELKVVDIPDDIEWEIKYYDGNEHIAEKHRTWG